MNLLMYAERRERERRLREREEKKKRVMHGYKLQCGECGFLSDTAGKAGEHAEYSRHTNFFLSEEPFIDQYCCSCPTHCNCPMALELHRKRTGHTEYEDTEAKLERKKAEEARHLQEYFARTEAAVLKENEEEVRKAQEKELRIQTRLLCKQAQMISCLNSVKQSLKFVEQEKRALNTLVKIVKNVAQNPAEEKFRRIKINAIEQRLSYVEAGFKFLELCKFEKLGEFLVLPSYEVEEELLNAANDELNRALSMMED